MQQHTRENTRQKECKTQRIAVICRCKPRCRRIFEVFNDIIQADGSDKAKQVAKELADACNVHVEAKRLEK